LATATTGVVAIGEHIATDKPEAARRWVERLRHQASLAADLPLAGRRGPGIEHGNVRETFLRSYRIVYRVEAAGITVLTVFEGHRLLRKSDSDDE
jgi:plasmid stabilization system protein ParE